MARNLAPKSLPADLNKFQKANSTGRRSFKTTNDNNQIKAQPETKATFSRLLNPASDNKAIPAITNTAIKVVDVAKAISTTWAIISLTWVLYLVQLIFAILSLMGMGALLALDNSWLYYADFFNLAGDSGELIMYLGMFLSLALGILSFLIALVLFIARGVEFGRSLSIFVAAFCFSAYVIPGLNLIPWVWVWCLYVVKSQTK